MEGRHHRAGQGECGGSGEAARHGAGTGRIKLRGCDPSNLRVLRRGCAGELFAALACAAPETWRKKVGEVRRNGSNCNYWSFDGAMNLCGLIFLVLLQKLEE